METFALLAGGLILLIGGGEILVRGAIALAKNLGISAAVIGLTILAYGTSAPELVVSLESALDGHADMAIGNVVGSNISNTLLILGVTALFYPLTLDKGLLKPDGYVLLIVSVLFWIFAQSGQISQLEGGLFIIMLLAYTYYTFTQGKKDGFSEIEAELEDEMGGADLSQPRAIIYTVIGLIVMVLGGKLLVNGGVQAATALGVSEGVIGLTIIAIGTSLPELATSLIAARKGQAGMAVGNVLGSNLMNIFGIVGFTAMIQPLDVLPVFLTNDIPLLIACSILLVFGIWQGCKLGRIAGSVGTIAFIGYIAVQY
ncbi:MAG: calcium/sodium antiporter [Rickettsiales bacterium]|nr:calcium/sodium antiporter [Rickettsiales bacterium]